MPAKRRTRLITPEDITRIVFTADAQISPDGSRVVFVHKRVGAKNAYHTNLWMACADGNGARAFTSGNKDTQPRWSPDGAQIAFVSNRTKPKPQIHAIDSSGGEARAVTDLPEGSIGAIKWSPDGTHIAFAFREQDPEWTSKAKKEREESGGTEPPRVLDDWWYRLDGDGYFNAQRYALYVVDVTSGAHRRLYAKDTLGGFTFDWSPDSKKLAVTTNRDKKAMIRSWKEEILIVDVKTGRFRPVPNLPEGPKTSVAWSPDGKLLAYAGREGVDDVYSTENLELWVCDPAKGNAKSLTKKTDECLLAICIGDTSGASFAPKLFWAPNSKRVYLRLGRHGESHLVSVARSGGALEWHTTGASEWDPGNVSNDGKRFAFVRNQMTTPPEAYVGTLERSGFATKAVSAGNAALVKELRLSRASVHWVKTADGTKCHTWVMMPPDHAKTSRKKYPAVLEIHGGPHGQYGVGFFHEFQVLAAQGYVVVFSNPRGSKGYGRDHCHAIRGHWGTADWVDIQAVTAFMQEHKSIDTKRMGVMGGSYGGYMTNWVIGHCRDYKAAITDRCVSNMVTMGGTSDYVDEPDRYFPGNWWDRIEGRWDQSPMKYLGNCKTPTLIIHSEGDLRCNIEQAEQVFMALKILNVPTRFVRYPKSTSHGMSRGGPPDMRVHRLGQITEWWAKYLK